MTGQFEPTPATVVIYRVERAVRTAESWTKHHSVYNKTHVMRMFYDAQSVGLVMTELLMKKPADLIEMSTQFRVPWDEFEAIRKCIQSVHGRSGWPELEQAIFTFHEKRWELSRPQSMGKS